MRLDWGMILCGLALYCSATGPAAAQSTPKGGSAEAAKIENPVPSSPQSVEKGKATFMAKCAPCHGPKADGTPQIMVEGGIRPADLTSPKYIYGTSDGDVFTNIRDGVLPNLNMPTWDGQIAEPDIWNLVNFLKTVRRKE